MFSLKIDLQARSTDTRGVTHSDFIQPLELLPEDGIEDTDYADTHIDRYRAANIIFPIVRLSAYGREPEPYEAFDAAVHKVLHRLTDFLDRRPTELFDQLRASKLKLRIFIEPRMDQNQFDFDFPPSFLSACARQQLGIYLITNDISAAEAIAAGAT